MCYVFLLVFVWLSWRAILDRGLLTRFYCSVLFSVRIHETFVPSIYFDNYSLSFEVRSLNVVEVISNSVIWSHESLQFRLPAVSSKTKARFHRHYLTQIVDFLTEYIGKSPSWNKTIIINLSITYGPVFLSIFTTRSNRWCISQISFCILHHLNDRTI